MYDTDQEQIEAMKSWWSQYGNWVIAGFLVFIATYVGVLWFQGHSLEKRVAASEVYDELLLVVSDPAGDPDQRDQLFAELKSEHESSGYAVMAALLEAKFDVESGDFESALTQLEWAESRADQDLISTIQYRQALVHFQLNDLPKALSVLDAISGTGHEALTHELRGDIFVKSDRLDEARDSYTLAIESAEEQRINNPYLQVKLNEIARVE